MTSLHKCIVYCAAVATFGACLIFEPVATLGLVVGFAWWVKSIVTEEEE